MPQIMERVGSDVLVVQGAVGTYLHQRGFEGNTCSLNLEEPDAIEQMHRLYRLAGADCAVTNTFLATSAQLAPEGLAGQVAAINMEGVRLAREAGFPHVLAAMGPCGVAVEPGSGTAALEGRLSVGEAADAAAAQNPAVGYATAREQYLEQASALAAAAPDAILLQTFTSLDDACAALDAARQACDLPVFVCMTFVGETGATAPDAPDAPAVHGPAECAHVLERAGAAAVGCNCMPPAETLAAVGEMRAACKLPLIALPSAGIPRELPRRGLVWPVGPDDFADAAVRLVAAGASIVGSCCGSTPACTGAIYAAVGGCPVPGSQD